MSRIQAYLPDQLHAELKRRRLSASKLLQEAVQREIRRARLTREVDRHLAEMAARHGPISRAERAAAEAWVDAIQDVRQPVRRKRAS
jgi:hypothetical protein